MAENESDNRDLVQVLEAADRAGAAVTDQIRAIVQSAETSASEIQHNAEQQADVTRRDARMAAARVLERIDAIETQLTALVEGLRSEADTLSAALNRTAAR